LQFIEIHTNNELFIRLPLGGFDLMQIEAATWEETIMERARLVEMLMNQFFREPILNGTNLKKPVYYLVFESKMKDMEISDKEMKEFEHQINMKAVKTATTAY